MQGHMKNMVIFDCDGVLVDSEQLANLALIECLAEINITMSIDEANQRFIGRRFADCLADVEKISNRPLPTKFAATYRARMGEYFESKLQPIHGVVEAVQGLTHAKCVASNGPLVKMKRNLEITGLLPFFGDNIFSAYTIEKWKPDPDLFLYACRTMGFEPHQCVVVEDSQPGIQAALAGGFKVLAYKIAIDHENVIRFQSMSELPLLVENIFAK